MKTSRRSFLLTGAAGALPMTLSTLTQEGATQAAPRRRDPASKGLRLGIVTYNIAATWDIDTIITRLTEVGMEGVELRTTHAHGVEPALTPRQRADVRKRFESSPVQLA